MQNMTMNRRELLSNGLAMVTATAAGAASMGRETVQQYREPLEAKLESLEQRFDKLEHHHKNLIRVGGLAFALSTGIDVVAFL